MSDATIQLLLAIADDKLMLGHRNSDWTGLGPILEEDIAFSALAQGDIAHAQALYEHVAKLTGSNADQIAFGRTPDAYRCAAIVETHDDFDWAYALARQFYCAHCDAVRFARLSESNDTTLAALAKRLAEEQVAHVEHADGWLRRLATDADAAARLQAALDALASAASMLFEPVEGEADLVSSGFYPEVGGPARDAWLRDIEAAAHRANLTVNVPDASDARGGRNGVHTDQFEPLLDEMCEVFRLEPNAAW